MARALEKQSRRRTEIDDHAAGSLSTARLVGSSTAPPPVASTRSCSLCQFRITCASRRRKPASPSISKISGMLHAGARLDFMIGIDETPLQASWPAGGRRWSCPRPSCPRDKYCRRFSRDDFISSRRNTSSGKRDGRKTLDELVDLFLAFGELRSQVEAKNHCIGIAQTPRGET